MLIMRELFFYLFAHPLQVGCAQRLLAICLFALSFIGGVRWLQVLSVSIVGASAVALVPAMIVHGWASSAFDRGGGDFSGFGYLFVPVAFYLVWIPALPVALLIAATSSALFRLNQNSAGAKRREIIAESD